VRGGRAATGQVDELYPFLVLIAVGADAQVERVT